VIALLAVAALHTAALPDGDTWWCSNSGCDREAFVCPAGETSMCAQHASVWVATAQDRKSGRWKFIAYVDEAACKAAVATTFKRDRSVSACAKVGKTDPQPPDATLVPKGKGWFCQQGGFHGLVASSSCFRAEAACHKATPPAPPPPPPGTAVIGDVQRDTCAAQATAWVVTDGATSYALESASSCKAARAFVAGHSACAELK
jgi:hypothetical protein